MRHLEHPEHVAVVFKLTNKWSVPATVSLLHLAAYRGWLDIVMNLKLKVLYECKDSVGQTPLHYAAVGGSLPVVQYLITVGRCNPAALGRNNSTLLDYGCVGGHMNIINYLITELQYDSTVHSNLFPLHIACSNGHLNLTKILITEKNCDPKCRDKNGWTPLHYASQNGHIVIVKYLITELQCDPMIRSNDGRLPLHIACRHGHLNVTKFLITEKNCDPKFHDKNSLTPLHYASQGGHINVIEYLITEQQCDPMVHNNNGLLPLHIACRHGHLNLVKYFILEQNCNPTIQDWKGWTPLHHASQGGHMNIIEYLITKLKCDPTIRNNIGSLPLHVACCYGHLNLTKYFMMKQNCDPTSLNDLRKTALHYACEEGHKQIIQYIITNRNCYNLFDQVTQNSFDLTMGVYFELGQMPSFTISSLFSAREFSVEDLFYTQTEVMEEFPIHSYNKVILTGNSAAGKTTLIAVITERAASWLKYGNVKRVELNTAGICPSHVKSRELGNLLFYDLAGHAEYHTSHYAVMETVMKQSPATFINIIDLSKSHTEITQQLSYWVNFINNAACRTTAKSCLIIVGSHADLLAREIVSDKLKIVSNLVKKRLKGHILEFVDVVSMDCRKIDCADTRTFTSLLSKSKEAMSSRAPSMSFICHFMYAVLQWRRTCAGTIAWKL